MEAVPYLLSPTGSDLLNRLVWMRVLCALLAGVTVWLTYRFLRELLPATPWAWTTGALALAFFPMFGFISGGVQNDDGLYVCAAALFWAMARVLRHGLTVRRGLAVGGALALGILMKYTMLGLTPAAVATVVVALWRDRVAGRPLPWAGAWSAAALAALPLLAYEAVSHWVWDRPLTGPLRASHPAVPHPDPATIPGQLSYAWELFLPRLPFMDDKFPGITPLWDTWYRGGIGRFGWLDYGFPGWVAIALLPVVVAIVALLVRELLIVRPRIGDLAVYALAVLGLMALLALVGYRYELKFETYFQSPRYLFALLPLAAAAVAVAARGAGRRYGSTLGAGFVVIVMALSVFAQLATLERYYGS
jgi:4-amino-4-deoxy-L-arabinose transferase-like glycosyltransferase